jgi:hypothetical protein
VDASQVCRRDRADERLEGDVPFRRTDGAQIIEAVAKTFEITEQQVFDRKLYKEAFHLVVYLLRRVSNLPLKQVADMAGVSCTRVSQIQKRFDNPDDLPILPGQTQALLEKYKVESRPAPPSVSG